MRDVKDVIRWFDKRNVTTRGAQQMYDAAVHYLKQYVKMTTNDPCGCCKHMAYALENCVHDGDMDDCRKCKNTACACKTCKKANHWEYGEAGNDGREYPQ